MPCGVQERIGGLSTRLQDLQAQIERQANDLSGLTKGGGGKENVPGLLLPAQAGRGAAPIAAQCHKLHSALQKLDRLRQARVSAAHAASDPPQVRRRCRIRLLMTPEISTLLSTLRRLDASQAPSRSIRRQARA